MSLYLILNAIEIEGKTENKEYITFKFVSFNNEKID